MDDALEKMDERQKTELYAAIGKFAVEFEMLCSGMRSVIMTILAKEGLSNDSVMEILLADQTAGPLQSLVRSLAAETEKLSEKDQKILGTIMNQVQKLTESRNDVLHATWLVGWVAFEDEGLSKALGTRLKRNKKGVATQRPIFKAADFDELASRAEQLARILGGVTNCFSFGEPLEKAFVLDDQGRITITPRVPARIAKPPAEK